LGARELIENKYEGSPEKKNLIGNGTEFENDTTLNRKLMKRFQEWDRWKNRGNRVTILAKQF